MEFISTYLIGRFYDNAETQEALRNRNYRTVSVDGKSCAITDDFQAERLNLSLDNGVIVKVTFG